MKTILFVDDELGSWSLAIRPESKGYKCTFATDMTTALEILDTQEVAVVVTVFMMPAGAKFPQSYPKRLVSLHSELRSEQPTNRHRLSVGNR